MLEEEDMNERIVEGETNVVLNEPVGEEEKRWSFLTNQSEMKKRLSTTRLIETKFQPVIKKAAKRGIRI